MDYSCLCGDRERAAMQKRFDFALTHGNQKDRELIEAVLTRVEERIEESMRDNANDRTLVLAV